MKRTRREEVTRPGVAALGVLAGCLAGCLSGPGARPALPREGEEVLRGLEDAPWADPARVVADVNGRRITQGDFYRRVLRQFGTKKLLAGVITQEIVLQEAAKRGLTAGREETDRKLDEIEADEARQAGGLEALRRQYEEAGITLGEAREDRRPEVEAQILLSKVVKSLRAVNDDDLREYYKATYAKTRYAARHIAYSFRPDPGKPEDDANRLKLEAHNRAARAADRIRKGADFAELARAESEDEVTRPLGGDLGAIPEGSEVVPEFMRGVFKLTVGEVSDPVENPRGGYHIFQVTAVLPGESFADCKEKIRREILEHEPTVEEVRRALLMLRKEAKVREEKGN